MKNGIILEIIQNKTEKVISEWKSGKKCNR